jgi:hypothetical protein
MSEHEQKLLALGFERCSDGTLRAPIGSVVTLKPIAQSYYELKIGNVLSCVIPQIALKTSSTTEPAAVDVETLIVGPARPRRLLW